MRVLAEQELQRVIVHHLNIRAVSGLVWFHPPNGGLRSRTEAAILKGLGVRAGVSDVILLHQGRAYALELKAPGGRTTDVQRKFQEEWRSAGGFANVAEGLSDALAQLEDWQLLRGTSSDRLRDSEKASEVQR